MLAVTRSVFSEALQLPVKLNNGYKMHPCMSNLCKWSTSKSTMISSAVRSYQRRCLRLKVAREHNPAPGVYTLQKGQDATIQSCYYHPTHCKAANMFASSSNLADFCTEMQAVVSKYQATFSEKPFHFFPRHFSYINSALYFILLIILIISSYQ